MTITYTTDNNELLPDGSPNPNCGVRTQVGTVDTPVPNNANNPYFPGWVPKTKLDFWALVQKVFITMAGNNADGADRYARLLNDRRSQGVVQMINATDIIDPDDKRGAFLWAVNFLTSTSAAADSQPLMSTAELAEIMNKSNWLT